jgi:uncharacterized protein DUF6600
MKTERIFAIAVVVALLCMMLQWAVPAAAQDRDDEPGQGDPSSRVARLNYTSGSVSFQPGGEGDWVTAVVNRPMTTGDNLWADQNSRAELHVGSTAFRMGAETSMTLLDLDDRTVQLRLSMGSLMLRVRHLDDGDLLEVDTPNLAFQVQSVGEYRIDVNQDGTETVTTVWHGRGEVTGGGASYMVVAGQSARFRGTDQLDHEIDQLPGSDDFANWAFSRDRREDRDESSNYISPEMTGYEDLDDYGHWHYAADYGPVWTPTAIAVGWAPYRFGHWVWIDPWGWTWIEDEPWGFAPFHYGRWAFVESSWCWVPGPVVVRPVYAPALVAFVGGGGFSLSLAVGGAGVAWFPLGPREVYVPPYRVSRTYVNQVNITNTRVNVTQVTNVYNNYTTNNTTRITYVNQRVPTAVTAVSHDTFVNSRPVARNLGQVDVNKIAQAPVTHAPPVQPVRQSVLGAAPPARAKPPAAVENRRVVATRAPTPPRPSFEQRKPTVNVRTEQPSQPQPAGRAPAGRGNEPAQPGARGNEAPRPGQPAAGSNEPARPEQPGARGNEAPRPGQPAAGSNEPARPEQPGARGNEAPRPGQPANAPPEGKQVPRPPNAGRPQEQQPAPRPEQGARPEQAPRGEQGARPQQAPRPEERPAPQGQQREDNGRPANAPHPLVRQAPPVQERPQQQQNEENKYRQWEQQRQSAPRPPASGPPEQRQERPQQKQQQQKQDKQDKQDKPEPK